MKKSIRSSLFILMVTLMVSFVSIGFILNVFLLEKYYVLKNADSIEKIVEEVNIVLKEKGHVQDRIEEIDRINGVSVFVANKENLVLMTSFPRRKDDDSKLPKEIEQMMEENGDLNNWHPIYSTVKKVDEQGKLVYVDQTPDGNYIVITKSMKGIYESVDMSNQFYVVSGLVVLLVGSFIVYKFSEKTTKPIIRMSEIAENISNLQFGQRIEFDSHDELGILASSINRLSDKLEVSIDGLKNDIEYQKSLSRNMFHELKTPLGVIKGYTEGIAYGVADTEDMQRRYLATIVDECDRMDYLVKEMLELSKLEAKDYTLQNIECFEVKKLLQSVIDRFQVLVSEKEINLLFECKEDIRINANYELMDRAMSNLISNAIKYNEEDRYIKLSASEAAGFVLISIYNTCSGIPEAELGRIFDVFYKGDKARTRENGGNGIGLTIVKSIVELHDGEITAKNKKGGVEFVVSLPKESL